MSDLRDVMRRWPQGVAVVTVGVEVERIGLTVSSVVSLSLEPPIVGVAISRQAAMHEPKARALAVGLEVDLDRARARRHDGTAFPPPGEDHTA